MKKGRDKRVIRRMRGGKKGKLKKKKKNEKSIGTKEKKITIEFLCKKA